MADEKRSRGRPRKNATPEQLESIQQFCDFMRSDRGSMYFANKISTNIKDLEAVAYSLSEKGIYNPIFSESLMQNLAFTSGSATSDNLQDWLQHPEQNAENLRLLSHYLENANLQYGRAASLLSDIKSYHYDLRCATPNLAEKAKSSEFRASYNKVLSFLRKLNIPYQIRRIDNKACKDGVAFVWFNRTRDTFDMIDLPTEFCHITAPWTFGYLFSVDLTYFDRFAFQQTQVPELWAAYEAFCRKREELVSSHKYSRAAIAPYQYMPVSPYDGWCFLFDVNRPIKVPPMVGAAGVALDAIGYRDLIKQKAVVDLWRVLAFKIPTDSTTGKMQITYKEASSIIDSIRSVLPENFVAFASPFDTEAPINADQTSVMEGLENISNKSFYDYSGIPNALFNSDQKSAAALKLATGALFAYASNGMYASAQNLVNWLIRIECGTQFDWIVKFHGNKLYEDEEQDRVLKMLSGANAPISYVMSHYGFEPFEIENEYVIENFLTNIKDKMKPLQLGSTMSSNEGGRPKEEIDSKRSESRDESIDAGE